MCITPCMARAAEKARARREALTAVGSVDINAVPVSKISEVAANITAGFNDKVTAHKMNTSAHKQFLRFLILYSYIVY